MMLNNMIFSKVLLFCLITYGHGRPSDNEEHDEIMREAKKEKYFQHDNAGEQHQLTESLATENMLSRLKSIAHLRTAETRKSAAEDSISREELEALKDLLDRNLLKYQNYDRHSSVNRKRPNEPYIGQILHSLNGELQSNDHNPNTDMKKTVLKPQQQPQQMPIRRKIIRHTVFSTPLNGGGFGGSAMMGSGNPNRLYGAPTDEASRIEWSSPWADYFPILIKDPFQTVMNSFSEIIEYGPAADICRHAATGGGDDDNTDADATQSDRGARETSARPDSLKRYRRHAADEDTNKGVLSHVRPLRPHHGTTTTSTEQPKVFHWSPEKQAAEHNGDMGPQIKRLVVRRGGVAIAGPGGIATAGSGGTAIVGPGGSAYSSKDSASGATSDVPASPMQPGGLSMAGYGPHAVQGGPMGYFSGPYPQTHFGYGRSSDAGHGGTALLSSDGVAYTFPVPSRGLTADDRRDDGEPSHVAASTAREISLPDGAKLIATGPIVYYNPEPRSSTVARKRSRKGKKTSLDSKKHHLGQSF